MRWVLNLLAGVLIRRGRFRDRDAHRVGGGGRSCDAEGRDWRDVGQCQSGPCEAVTGNGRALGPPEGMALPTPCLESKPLLSSAVRANALQQSWETTSSQSVNFSAVTSQDCIGVVLSAPHPPSSPYERPLKSPSAGSLSVLTCLVFLPESVNSSLKAGLTCC